MQGSGEHKKLQAQHDECSAHKACCVFFPGGFLRVHSVSKKNQGARNVRGDHHVRYRTGWVMQHGGMAVRCVIKRIETDR